MKWLMTWVFVAMLALPAGAAGSDGADLLRRADGSFATGDYRTALRLFTEAARLKPDSFAAWRGVGLCRLRLGANEVMNDPAMLTDAAAAFNTALSLKSDDAEVHYHLGMTWLELDDRQKAGGESEILGKLDPALAARLRTEIGKRKPVAAFREIGGERPSGDGPVRVLIIGNQVLVPVTISFHGNVTQARLLLDTGASFTTISPAIAEGLGIDQEHAKMGVGQVVGGALIRTRLARLDSVTVGSRTRTGILAHIVPHNGPPVPFEGLLGMDFLRGLTYQVDFKNGLLTWGR